MSETTLEQAAIDHGTLHLRHNPDYNKPYWVLVTAEPQLRMRPLTLGMYRSRRLAERRFRRYAHKYSLDQRHRGGKDYTPPTYEEFRAAVGHVFDTRDNPFASIAAYDNMKLAMSCQAYDRDEAFDRLRGIAETHERFNATMEQIGDIGRRW